MPRISIETRGISNWRERLAKPDEQWKRGFSAFEAAVAWEVAAAHASGIPQAIREAFVKGGIEEPTLLHAVAEHKVPLDGDGAATQCDLWALVRSKGRTLSLSLEAKASETFGDKTLEAWLEGTTQNSKENRAVRWKYIAANLPIATKDNYHPVRYQILHRCAASVIEAQRFGLQYAVFVVQAFNAPDKSYHDFTNFCSVVGLVPTRNRLFKVDKPIGNISLFVGWVDCPFATDAEIAAVAA